MSSDALPDDPARWPTDPYKLLGVPRTASRGELRRAYTRLLKQYKPEHAPEEFRRLRQAFEQATSWVSWNEEPSTPPDQGEDRQPPTRIVSEQPAPSIVVRSVEEQVRNHWDSWLDQPAEAYRALTQLVERHPHCSDIYAPLYWMLSMQPQLDTGRAPCEWLVRGLSECDWPATLHALYAAEIERQPTLALSDRYTQLLLSVGVTGRTVDLAQRRWRSAARIGQWSVMASDLELLRPRFEREAPATWLQLLLLAVDELAWGGEADRGEPFEKYASEIDRLGAVRLADFDALARFDNLRELAACHRRAAANPLVPDELLTLSARSWTHSYWEIRREAASLLEQVFAKPQYVLDSFDHLGSMGAVLLAQLRMLLASLESLAGTQGMWTAELRQRHIVDFLDRAKWTNYRKFRPLLWSFCRTDFISPEQVAEAIQPLGRFELSRGTHLAETIQDDLPLRCACQAHCAIARG